MHASYSLLGLGVVLSLASPVVAGGDGKIWTKAEKELPDWALKNTLQLNLSADSTNYAVFPLTEELVHGNTNEEEVSRETAWKNIDFGVIDMLASLLELKGI